MADFKEDLWLLLKGFAGTLIVVIVLYAFWPQFRSDWFFRLFTSVSIFLTAIFSVNQWEMRRSYEEAVSPRRLRPKIPQARPIGAKPPQPSEPKPRVGGKLAEALNGLEDVEEFGIRTLEQAKAMLEQAPRELLEPATLEQDEALENEGVLTLEQDEKLEQREMLKPPTKEELQRLKEVLELGKGSLSYKKRGEGVYHVIYNSDARKHKWTRIGSWPEIQAKLTE